MIGPLHLALLLGCFTYCSAAYSANWLHRTVVTFLALWADLVLAAYLLSIFSQLGHPMPYLAVSMGLALLAVAVTFRAKPFASPPKVVFLAVDPVGNPAIDRALVALMLLGAVAAIGCTLVIVASFDPNNYDSLAYRFARVMLYIGQGHLLHPSDTDPRLSYYPFCGTLLYVFPGTYGMDGRTFNLPGLFAWLVGAGAVAAFARDLGASRRGAIIASGIYLTAPSVLVSAASTNDDMLAGVPLLCGVLFAGRWWSSRRLLDACLAATGVGLSFGTKLHFLFYDLFVFFALVAILVRAPVRKQVIQRLVEDRTQILAACALVALFALPPLVINWFEAGRIVPPFPSNMNRPFSMVSAGVNLVLYSTQLLFSDLPNIDVTLSRGARQAAVTSFNRFFNEHFLGWVDTRFHYHAESLAGASNYVFRGVADPTGGLGPWEQSVWLGLIPWLLVLAPLISLRSTRRGAGIAFWLSASLLFWHLARCVHAKYIEAAGIYYAFPIAVAAPALAWLWDTRPTVAPWARRLVTAGFSLVIVSNLMISYNLFTRNHQRNIPLLLKTSFHPTGDPVSPELAATLRQLTRIHFVYTHWELEMFALMMKNMRARYTAARQPVAAADTTNLYAFPLKSRDAYVPIRIPDASSQRLAALGRFEGLGTEVVLGSGPLPQTLGAEEWGYLMVRLGLVRDLASPNKVNAVSVEVLAGQASTDDLQFRVTRRASDPKEQAINPWLTPKQLRTPVELRTASELDDIVVHVRQRSRPDEQWSGRPLPYIAETMAPRARR